MSKIRVREREVEGGGGGVRDSTTIDLAVAIIGNPSFLIFPRVSPGISQ